MPKRHLIHEICTGPNKGQWREPSLSELALALEGEKARRKLEKKIRKAQKKLAAVTKDCARPVCYDTAGGTYDIRTCIICGHTSLI